MAKKESDEARLRPLETAAWHRHQQYLVTHNLKYRGMTQHEAEKAAARETYEEMRKQGVLPK